MATVSFTRNMKLNSEESENLLDIIKANKENNFKITTPPAKETSKKTLSKVFGK